MRRTWWGRALSALTAVWLALALSGPPYLRLCPVHSLASHASHGATHGPTHSPTHGGTHGGAHGHASAERTLHGPVASEQTPHAECVCLDQCSDEPPTDPCAADAIVASAAAIESTDAGLPGRGYVPLAVEHVLPFQNGPPAAA